MYDPSAFPPIAIGPSAEADAAALWSLGLGEPHPVSALHGRGTGDMLDAVLRVLPQAPAQTFASQAGGPRRVALIGRPNVGKSSLLNKMAGEQRVVVDDVAGVVRLGVSTLAPELKELRENPETTKTDLSRAAGKLLAEKARAAGIVKVVFDRGGYLYHGRVAAFAEGAREGGLEF